MFIIDTFNFPYIYFFLFIFLADSIQFTLPSFLLPPKPIEQPDTTLRAVISMDMHDKVHGVASKSHPETVSFIQFVGGKASADVVMVTYHYYFIFIIYWFLCKNGMNRLN